jgi:hypothetical protein
VRKVVGKVATLDNWWDQSKELW